MKDKGDFCFSSNVVSVKPLKMGSREKPASTLAVKLYRKCAVHGIIGAAWTERNPPCPKCGKRMRKLSKMEVKEIEKRM